MEEQEIKHVQENLRYLGFPHKNGLSHVENAPPDLPSQENGKKRRKRKLLWVQKENNPGSTGIKASSVKKTSEVKQQENSPFEPAMGEGKALKRKILGMSGNHSSPNAHETELLKVMKMTQAKEGVSSASEKGLTPGLSDPLAKKNKICRPPNAFMLFAKEHRSRIGIEYPTLTNGERSYLLGGMWRDMSDEDKVKYYKESETLQKLHKEAYPNYVYSPAEARLRKQLRTENKLRSKQALLLKQKKATHTTPNNSGVLKNRKLQEIDQNSAISNNKQELIWNTPKRTFNERPGTFLRDPFQSPLYYSKGSFDRTMAGNSNSCCPCPNHAFDGQILESNQSRMSANASSSSSNYDTMSAASNTFDQPFHGMFSNSFHPAVWNPWVMWPGSLYNTKPGQNLAALSSSAFHYPINFPTTVDSSSLGRQNEKNVAKSTVGPAMPEENVQTPLAPNGKNSAPRFYTLRAANALTTPEPRLSDEELDDGFKPLVIDDKV